jgi:branched-chain amino acid transport system permease protein
MSSPELAVASVEKREPSRSARIAFGIAAAGALALAFPGIIGYEDYMIYNGCIALIWLLMATGYNFLIGMCGQMAMSHIAFFGIGAYVSALLTRNLHVSYLPALAAALILPALCAWIMAKAAVKFVGPYLAMITFAFHSMCYSLFINWKDLTNGWEGVRRIPPITSGEFAFNTPLRSYYLLLGVSALALYVAFRIKYSRTGRAFFAVRENRLAAKGAGIDTGSIITLAFCLSGVYAGLAGSMLAHFVRYIDPTSFDLRVLIDLLIILIVGGRGSILGVTVTSIIFIFSLEYLRFLQDWKLMVFGLLLILVINASPNGVGELFRLLGQPRGREVAQ